MSTENKAEMDKFGSDTKDEASHSVEHESPANMSEKSSSVSWNTPVSTTKSESTPSSVSWNTPKSFKSSGEYVELVRTTDDSENTLVHSPALSTIMIPADDPPPYPCDERQALWSPLRHIQDPFCDDYESNRSRELASLIENPISAPSTPPLTHMTPLSSGKTYIINSLSRISFRKNDSEYPKDVKEQECGTICIVSFFIVFLMILSLIARFLIFAI